MLGIGTCMYQLYELIQGGLYEQVVNAYMYPTIEFYWGILWYCRVHQQETSCGPFCSHPNMDK